MENRQHKTMQYGPFSVVGPDVPTEVYVKEGDSIRTQSYGMVNFCWPIGPKRDPDGEDFSTPEYYPCPNLKKNSLVCKIGSRCYQGGTEKTFYPTESGELILRANDSYTDDNRGEWVVTIYHTT